MTFLWPAALTLAFLIPLGLLGFKALDDRRRRRAAAFGLTATAPGRGSSGGPGRAILARIPALLFVAAFGALVVALARPQATVPLPRSVGTVMLAFDVSASMAATDVEPNRLEQAKAAAKAFIDRQPPGVVVGVTAFSDAGLTVQLPTRDPAAVQAAIDRLLPTRGTSLGLGILASLQAIADAEARTPAGYYSNIAPDPEASPSPPPDEPEIVAPGSHRSALVVVLSDGDNNQEPDPAEAALLAAERGIRVVTVGVGSAAGTTVDLEGFAVHTHLDEGVLRGVAETTAGTYLPADEAAALPALYDSLDARISLADEEIELTAIVAAIAVGLLAAGAVFAFAREGRLP